MWNIRGADCCRNATINCWDSSNTTNITSITHTGHGPAYFMGSPQPPIIPERVGKDAPRCSPRYFYMDPANSTREKNSPLGQKIIFFNCVLYNWARIQPKEYITSRKILGMFLTHCFGDFLSRCSRRFLLLLPGCANNTGKRGERMLERGGKDFLDIPRTPRDPWGSRPKNFQKIS